MEPPFGHLTFRYISCITEILYSHTFLLPIDKCKLARKHGLGILSYIRGKQSMPTQLALSPLAYLSIYVIIVVSGTSVQNEQINLNGTCSVTLNGTCSLSS